MSNQNTFPEILLTCQGPSASARVIGRITHRIRGVRVRVTLDSAWQDLIPSLICACGDTCLRLTLTDGQATLPSECCTSGQRLRLGVDGWSAEGDLRIPTVWADCGTVLRSVAEAEAPEAGEEPSPGWQQQVYALAFGADQTAREVLERADSGEFDGKPGTNGCSPYIGDDGIWYVYSDSLAQYISTGIRAKGDIGAVDQETVANAITEFLRDHPLRESDPTVPSWAKQPSKPTYTAAEVGALPVGTPIPSAVTEQTVAGWGFTKNTGTYTKPAGGIPASDLASGVIPTIPQKLPTPNKLTFTGAATGEFDGSEPLNIEIPQGDGGTGGAVTLHTVAKIVLTEQTNNIIISEDSDHTPISQYHPIGIGFFMFFPKDNTQTNTNVGVWAYPSATNESSAIRAIFTVANAKTLDRPIVQFFFGNKDMLSSFGIAQISTSNMREITNDYMDGLRIKINATGDHFPSGTEVSVVVLGVKP